MVQPVQQCALVGFFDPSGKMWWFRIPGSKLCENSQLWMIRRKKDFPLFVSFLYCTLWLIFQLGGKLKLLLLLDLNQKLCSLCFIYCYHLQVQGRLTTIDISKFRKKYIKNNLTESTNLLTRKKILVTLYDFIYKIKS